MKKKLQLQCDFQVLSRGLEGICSLDTVSLSCSFTPVSFLYSCVSSILKRPLADWRDDSYLASTCEV
jgi:hypothetical protein